MAAQAQDLRTPGHPRRVQQRGCDLAGSATVPADLRSPNARDTSRNAITAGPADLRTPDSRDAAEGRGTFNAPQVALIEVPQPSPTAADGMDWGRRGHRCGDLCLRLLLLGLGSVLAVMHRRHGASARRSTATTG